MNGTGRNNTGGRGNSEIQFYVNSLLHRYREHMGLLAPPIKSTVLAKLQNAEIYSRQGSPHWVSSLMPMGDGFVINVNENLTMSRKRNAICHEVAHTFFFDFKSKPPRRIGKPRPDAEEERVCFWAAREMLVPASLLVNALDEIGRSSVYTLSGIRELARSFLVSADLISWRLTHDLSLLGDDWITLWYATENKIGRKKPMTLYPKHMSSSISDYMKTKISEALYTTLSKCFEEDRPIEDEIAIGKRAQSKLKVRTEAVRGHRLSAVSWVSPLSRPGY